MKRAPFPNPDWWERNATDGQEFFGYDRGDGTTVWYTPDGTCDSVTATPDEKSIPVSCKIWEGRMKHLS